MKRLLLLSIIFLNVLLSYSQSVAVNTDGTPADTSAMLDVKSSIKGILIPRMSTVEKNAIVTPATGLLVFDNDALSFWFFNGANWIELGGGGAAGSWAVNGANIYNANAGNVGIGTIMPVDKLTVQTPGASYGLTHTDGVTTVGTWIGTDAFFPGGWVGTKSNHQLNFFTAGGVSKMTVFPNGNVIVGDNTTTPYGRLTVRTANNSDGISHIGNDGNILATRIGGTSAGIGTWSNTHMRLFCNGRSDVFIAAATGNVGIGTENFGTYKLAVNGNIRTKELVVETGWADYVFDKAYTLPLLTDVEKFIKQNGHLPNIPSAKDVEEKGLHVGDVQKRMMEKIEELTLYVIALNKELAEVKKQIGNKK